MVVFFVMEILPIEVTAMGAIGVLLLFDILSWQEAISGFSNPAVITIGAIFIMSRALVKTGFLEVFADFLAKKGGNQKWLTIFIFLLTVSIISGVINNTAAVAIFIPLAIDLCQRFRISTDYTGWNPDVSQFGNVAVGGSVDTGPYPMSKALYFNVSVGL